MDKPKRISTTLITNILDDNNCPYKIKAVYVDKTHRSPTTKAQSMGLYFESQILGPRGDGSQYEVPNEFKLKDGSPSTDELRVKEMAEKMKNDVFSVYNIDLSKSFPFRRFEILFKEDNIMLTGEFDLLTSVNDPEYGQIRAIVDIKLTKNINYENVQYGGWSWRYPQNRDHTQAYMYEYAYSLLYPKEPVKFYYFVADYKKVPEHRVFRKKVGPMERRELLNSIEQTSKTIDAYNEKGWPYQPSYTNCRNCPLKSECQYAITRPPIQEV